MGLCSSKDEDGAQKVEAKASKKLDDTLAKSNAVDRKINKLLLLGAGESGKSTLFKALITIYGTGYPEIERKTFLPIIWNNIITSMKTLTENANAYGPVQSQEAAAAKTVFDEQIKGDEDLDAKLSKLIVTLWRDPGIQKTYQNRAKFQLFDSAEYFFERVDSIATDGYLPSEQDILRCRVRTTGIVETSFEIGGSQFKMFDVGGQRNERKKWIHCFENVTAVIFVAAISEYDQSLFEDETTNRMDEALVLFDEICNSKWFRETAMILFLNKCDLFAEKITRVPLTVCFSGYQGENAYEPGCAFLKEQFEGKNRNPHKSIYTHVTCATDTRNINRVFDAVKDIIIRKSLTDAGLA